jgi:ribonuclease P/MRP protein subunit RPP40
METRRLRGDLIGVFKMFKGMDYFDVHKFFQLTIAPTRAQSLKLVKYDCILDIRKFSFSHRVLNTWNSLSEDIDHANQLTALQLN